MTRRTDRLVAAALVGGLAVVAGVLAVASLYLGMISQAVSGVQRVEPLRTYEGRPGPNPATSGTAMNFLILGVSADGSLESVLIGHLSGQRDSFQLIALPAALHPFGFAAGPTLAERFAEGPQLVLQSVERLLGVRMDHLAELRLPSFVQLADSLGGVAVQNHTADLWPTGLQTLDAAAALRFAESPASALLRLERSTSVLTAILRKLADGGLLADPARLDHVAQTLNLCLTVDAGLTPEVVRQTAVDLRLGPDQVTDLPLPMRLAEGPSGRVVIPDAGGVAELAQAMAEDRVLQFVADHPDAWAQLRSQVR